MGLSIAIGAAMGGGAMGPAIAGALAALAGLHMHVSKGVADESRLTSSPGYVLLKARDLLRHAE
jgi:hypothetical protein